MRRRLRTGEVTVDREPTTSPDVSIVVPTRNRVELLRRLLLQLVSLPEGLRYEIVVVDEGSSDPTPELLEQMSRQHGVLVVRHDDPVGLPGARNAGFRCSSGRYVSWIDDDDLTAPDRLARQFAALEHGPARWSCAGRIDVDDDLEILGHVSCPPLEGLLEALLRSNVLPSAAQGLLVERSLVEQVGMFDESLTSAEDWDFAIRLLEVGLPVLIDEPLVGYRTGVASMSTDTARMETMIRAVIDKHRDLYVRTGASPDWSAIHQSLLPGDLLAGRAPAASRAWKSLRAGPSLGALRRLVLVCAAPHAYARASALRRREQVPPQWAAAARPWLDRVERA